MPAPSPESSPPGAHPWVAAGRDRVRFGVAYGPQLDQPPDWGGLIAFAQAAEALGFDSFWTADHPLAWSDCWATLMPLALATRTIRLGPLVSCVYYRSPVATARLAADLDQLSGGRLVLGVGTGDNPAEFARLGLPFPPPRERQAALGEALAIITGLWRGEPVTLEGRHFRVRGAALAAGPVQHPRVPILIAGGGERYTLRLVARRGDMSNFGAHPAVGSAFTLDDVRRKVAALASHCAALARPVAAVACSNWAAPVVVGPTPEAVRRKLAALPDWMRGGVASSTVAGTPAEVVAHYRPLVAAGLRYFMVCVTSSVRRRSASSPRRSRPSSADRPAGRRDGRGAPSGGHRPRRNRAQRLDNRVSLQNPCAGYFRYPRASLGTDVDGVPATGRGWGK